MDIHPTITELLSKLSLLPAADRILVFGSIAKGNATSKDLDVTLLATDFDDFPLAMVDESIQVTAKAMIALARKHYGWLDPFVATKNTLAVRNDHATAWVRAQNAKSLTDAILRDGVRLHDLMQRLGLSSVTEPRPARSMVIQPSQSQPDQLQYHNLKALPRTERLAAIANVIKLANEKGIKGMSGECGEFAVAMKRVLFAGDAEILAGLNAAFEQHGMLIGHFVVRIDDELYDCCQFDVRGVPLSDDEVHCWGMVDANDIDYIAAARDYGFELTQEMAENSVMLIFDDDDILSNMPGSGLAQKIAILQEAMRELGYCSAPDLRPVPDQPTPHLVTPSGCHSI